MYEYVRERSITFCQRKWPISKEKLHPMLLALRASGQRVTPALDGRLELDTDGILWIQGNANWFPKVCWQLAKTPKQRRPFVFHWFSEPLPPPRAAGLPKPRLNLREVAKILLRDRRATDVYSNYFRLRYLARKGLPDLLVASTPARCEFLAEHGIPAHWVPLAYDPALQGYPLGTARDIDVLFLGFLAPRRKKMIKRLGRRGVPLQTMGGWHDPAFWGENRTRLLNRAKIFLNIARYPGELPGKRLILGMANKALVISEPIYRPAPYVPGKHFVMCTLDEMPDIIRHYLDHDEERERIANQGYRLVSQEVTVKQSITQILKLLNEQLRSIDALNKATRLGG